MISQAERVSMAKIFLDTLYGNVTGTHFGYLWTKQARKTYPFNVADAAQRTKMARKAIELNDGGADVYFGVNLTDEPPQSSKRVTAEQVTLQTATVADIDTEGGNHRSDDRKVYPPNVAAATNFLPCPVSLIVNSGYGLHAYCIFSTPLILTDDNRKDCETRNHAFIDAIRRRAGKFAKAVDGVGDLPRVLRLPGTYNYKLGNNAPLCRIVEVNDVRFNPSELDARLALEPPKSTQSGTRKAENDAPTENDRIQAMLDFISPSSLTYDEWLAVGMALKNIGCECSYWENWSRADERFKEGECERKWQGFRDNGGNGGITAATIHDIAKRYGYSEKAFQRDWYTMHNPRIIHRPPDAQELSAKLAELKAQPQSKQRDNEIIATIRDLCSWNFKKGEMGLPVKTTIKSIFANMELIFDNDPNLAGLFGFDNFQGENVFLKKAPWHDGDQSGDKWRDSDDAELRNYLRKNYAELKERQLIEDYVIHYANKNSFNAVKNFFETLEAWDGIPRAENLFVTFLGAEDCDYTHEVTMKWLLGTISRVYHPGCDFQWAPVLQGAQRIGKSKMAKMLGGKEGVNPNGYSWHVALKDSVDDSHAVDALQKGAIIEIEEFSAARKAEINALKSFISADEDTRRFAYDKHASTRKRHVTFVVTCNDSQFLRDHTGNARFWCIKCTQQKFKRVEGMTPEYIRQVWAEVYFKYNELFKDGFDEAKLKPSLELELRAEEIAEAYTQDDGMTTEIKAFLDKKLPHPLIWSLMNKVERAKFFIDGQFTFTQATLNYRRRARGGREDSVERDINAITQLLNSQRTDIYKFSSLGEDHYQFFGSEYRQHICAAEIFNECFGTGDKRKLMYRFNEILDTLEGWHLGERLRTDPEYREQKKPYYRDEENYPADKENQAPNQPVDDFQGTPIEANDTPPFDTDDLPI